jgi:hypothetical protein
MIATLVDITLVALAIAVLTRPIWLLVVSAGTCLVPSPLGDQGPWIPSPTQFRNNTLWIFVGSLLIGVATSNIMEKLL